MFRTVPRRLFQVIFAHDVIAVKDAPGFVSRFHHGNPFRNASANRVSNRCAPEVMHDLCRESGFLPRLVPRLAKTLIGFPSRLEHIRAKQGRRVSGDLRHLAPFPLALHRFQQFTVKDYQPTLIVLVVPTSRRTVRPFKSIIPLR